MKQYKYEEIAANIESKITGGQYLPGHRLPSVRTLKQHYRISLSTIQSACDELLLRALVESAPRSGNYVSARPATGKVNATPIVMDPVSNGSCVQE
ncbi:winged helix-turn-helix domain-containing protein [Chitinophaga sp. OAE865]|uniref:GntR family transcriptional regulator n=1 Tax=Chitinophaga sp. OAE865 TaxID=2817898 RepID=UPI001AE87A35